MMPRKLGLGEGVADERPHHPEGDLLVGQPRQRRDLAGRQPRPGLGHVEPAVAREPRQHRLLEVERRGGAAGRDVLHAWGVPQSIRRLIRQSR